MASGFMQRFKGKIAAAVIQMQVGGQFYCAVAEGLTAHAGGGQGSATPIPAMVNRFTTVATIGDSSILPKQNIPGVEIVVINAGAASMNVFPDSGSTINGGAANAAFALAAGKTASFFTTLVGAWHAQLSA